MEYLKRIKELESELKAEKDKVFNAIVSDQTISKKDKIHLVAELKLLPVGSSCEEVFSRYYPAFNDIITSNNDYIKEYGNNAQYTCIDDCSLDSSQRHEIIYLTDLIDFNATGSRDKITILTNRTTKDIFQITPEEYIDTVYEWMITNKMIGFELDW